MANADYLWIRYIPGLAATAAGALLIGFAPKTRQAFLAVVATLVGLICMEAEYWVAHGFPESGVPFFTGAAAITLTALFLGNLGGVLLASAGFGFFAYVNLRYGAPYLLDYVMPVLYATLFALSRRGLGWFGSAYFRVGLPEAWVLIAANILIVWRTTTLGKWGWLLGRAW
jgi:hypothetical protein